MIRHTIIFALAILISSCGNKTENSNNIKERGIVSSDTIIPFYGFWAIEKYINTLTKTKSPRESQDDGEFFRIPESYKDRAFACVYHECGGGFHIIKSNNSYYLKADYDKNDSTEIVFTDDGNKMKIRDRIYIKTHENIGIPEDILFKGQYKWGDRSVTLNADGTIVGLDSIKFYSVENDYIGPARDFDIIYIGKNKDQLTTDYFKFIADTLFIYSTKCLEKDDYGNCVDIDKAELKYKLQKE